jgi:hypothetical protein
MTRTKERKAAYDREKWANTTPEQKEAKAAYMREWNAKQSPEYKEARAVQRREYRAKNPDILQAIADKKHRELRDPKHWAKWRLVQIKNRCKKKGLDFNLEESDLVLPTSCPVLGIPLYMGLGVTDHNSIHVDRVDNDKGYIKGNIQIISGRANFIKGDTTLKEIEAVAKYMREHQ